MFRCSIDYNTNLCQRLKSIPTTSRSPVTVIFIDTTAIQTTHNQSIYFENKQQLISIIEDLDKIDLKNIAKSMKSIADKEYIWPIIAEKYANIF
jgi:hypothetical protein